MNKEKLQELTPLETDPTVLEAMKSLIASAAADVPCITEYQFTTYLLPALLQDPANGPVDLSFWLDVAGTTMRPIDVADAAGTILFRIPPLIRTVNTQTQYEHSSSIGQVVTTAKMKSDIHPVLGNTYLQQHLEPKAPAARPDLDTTRKWNAILVRYGYPPVRMPGDEPAAQPAQPPPSQLTLSEEQDEF